MLKKKQIPRNNIAFIALIIIILLGFGIFLSINRIIENEEAPTPQVTIEPSPAHELFAGEEVLYIYDDGIAEYFHDEIILGAHPVQLQYFQVEDELRHEFQMVILFNSEFVIAYEGLEWDYEEYHFRVLEIDKINETGFSIIAISENEN